MHRNFEKTRFHYIIIAITLIGIVLIMVYLINTFVNNKYKYDSSYDSATAIEQIDYQFFHDAGQEFEVGMNKLKYPVFKNVDLALLALETKYGETLNKIQEQFKLGDFSSKTCEEYMTYAPMIDSESEEELAEANFISKFANIYKNSYSNKK